VEAFANSLEPVDSSVLSTVGSHRANGVPLRFDAVFPVVHTPYDFYERI
jgi:hypothetical protein